MKLNGKLLTLAMLALLVGKGFGQGFLNLNFEQAQMVTHSLHGEPFVYSTNAIPSWIPYLAGIAQDYVASNGQSLGGAQINIERTNTPLPYPPVQANYFILLQGAGVGSGNASASIGQTGSVPVDAQSILFWGAIFGGLNVTFNGNLLSFSTVGTTPNNYNIYEADISAYAGLTGELLFTTPRNTSAIIDNIQFSTTAVPEPSTLALVGLGGLGLAFVQKRRASRLCSKE